MPTGAPLLPIQGTKVGPGDKERAYVVRQNVCLKVLLGMLVFFGMLSTLLISTMYEVKVQRRKGIVGLKAHREEDHASHMRVMRLSMLLQRHLEDDVHDVKLLTTYRAWLMRSVGDYQSKVVASASNCSSALKEHILTAGVQFDADIERVLHLLWDDIVRDGETAKHALHNITHAIVSELRQDESEQGAYERVMAEAGEDPGQLGYHDNEGEYHGHHHGHHGALSEEMERREREYAAERHYRGEEEPEDVEADEEHDPHGHEHDPYHDPDDDDEEHLAGALEALLLRLRHNDSVLVGVANETLTMWSDIRESSLRALSDEEQEVDMERINKKILAAVERGRAASPALRDAIPAFNATHDGSELDYLTELLHRARLAPHQQDLLIDLEAWQAGDVPINVPLQRVEQLIDDEVLEPDVLITYDHMYNDGYPDGDWD